MHAHCFRTRLSEREGMRVAKSRLCLLRLWPFARHCSFSRLGNHARESLPLSVCYCFNVSDNAQREQVRSVLARVQTGHRDGFG